MSFKKIFEKIEDYLVSRLLLLKIEATDKASRVIAIIVIAVVFTSLATLFLFFFSFGAALYLGDLLGYNAYGFMAVSFFYLLLLIFVLIFKKGIIQKPILDWTVKYLFKKDNDTSENEEEQKHNK